jgi:CRISPR-associated exonuclease Cas4
MHKRAHDGADELLPGLKITHSLPVRSLSHGLSGQCDIVEFHKDGSVFCVEYKRGKPKAHRADEVQVCAQALCLEEMLDIAIEKSFLFYGKRKRRTEVVLDAELRSFTINTANDLHNLIKNRETPTAEYDRNLCDACSLIELCQPKTLRFKRGAAAWFQSQVVNATTSE